MRELIAVRHAFAGSNRDGVVSCTAPGEGLTLDGREQAIALRGLLAEEEIDLGAATGFARTHETLDLALHGRTVPRIVVSELAEIHFGRFDGGPLDAYRAWAGRESPLVAAPGGGESRSGAASRFARGLRVLLARPEAVVLLVAHALPLRYVLDAARGLLPAARMTPVEHAAAHRLSAAEVEAAATLLEAWSAEPRFRDPSNGAPAGTVPGRPPNG